MPSEIELFDYLVLGAGIMGMETARLLSKFSKVALVDINSPGKEASWAAAGILVSRGTRRAYSPSRQLYCRSIAYYPEWIQELRSDSGEEITIKQSADYCLIQDKGILSRFEGRLRAEMSVYEEIRGEYPSFFSENLRENSKLFYFPEEQYVNNRELLSALIKIIHEEPKITCLFNIGEYLLDIEKDITLKLEGRTIKAKQVVICSGCWSNQVLESFDYAAPLEPVRGQIYMVPNFHGNNHMIHIDDQYYMIPRGDSLMVGGISEIGQDEKNCTDDGRLELENLFNKHLSIDFEIPKECAAWSGIRPKTKDAQPFIGFLGPEQKIILNFGHYRTGISLAPLSCYYLVQGIRNGEMPLILSKYSVMRENGLLKL